MIQERKEYRKSFNSPGQLYVAGELLNFISYDVSVKGILVEIIPGVFLSSISDFEALLEENNSAEIYVKDLMLTGEIDIAWTKLEDGKIKLGLEFRNVRYNADKLRRKRNYYRSENEFSGHLIVDDNRMDFQGIDMSVDGMAIHLAQTKSYFELGGMIKVIVNDSDIKSVGKIIWINAMPGASCALGLRYLILD